jgi:hypothetical protein
LSPDPLEWTEANIQTYLVFVASKFLLPDIDSTAFPTSGRELCALSRAEFSWRAGEEAGDKLFQFLTHWRGEGVEPDTSQPSSPFGRQRTKRPSSSSTCSSTFSAPPSVSPSHISGK